MLLFSDLDESQFLALLRALIRAFVETAVNTSPGVEKQYHKVFTSCYCDSVYISHTDFRLVSLRHRDEGSSASMADSHRNADQSVSPGISTYGVLIET